jgi:hypothetical protein
MKLETRQMIEKKIFSRVVKSALEKGLTLSVFDGEEYTVKNSAKYFEIMAEFSTTDEDYLVIHQNDDKVGWVRFIYGNDGYDVISDYTANDLTEEVVEPASLLADKLELQYC